MAKKVKITDDGIEAEGLIPETKEEEAEMMQSSEPSPEYHRYTNQLRYKKIGKVGVNTHPVVPFHASQEHPYGQLEQLVEFLDTATNKVVRTRWEPVPYVTD